MAILRGRGLHILIRFLHNFLVYLELYISACSVDNIQGTVKIVFIYSGKKTTKMVLYTVQYNYRLFHVLIISRGAKNSSFIFGERKKPRIKTVWFMMKFLTTSIYYLEQRRKTSYIFEWKIKENKIRRVFQAVFFQATCWHSRWTSRKGCNFRKEKQTVKHSSIDN